MSDARNDLCHAPQEDSLLLPTVVAGALCGADPMKITFPNSADLRNITHFLKSLDTSDSKTLEFNTHNRWTYVHPVVLALTACAAALVTRNDGTFSGTVYTTPSMNYPARMGLFNLIKVTPPLSSKNTRSLAASFPLLKSGIPRSYAQLLPIWSPCCMRRKKCQTR
jgi:hypothetical protein